MSQSHISILDDSSVRDALKQAWFDSVPGPSGGHEEGGLILQDEAGTLSILRWGQGTKTKSFSRHIKIVVLMIKR